MDNSDNRGWEIVKALNDTATPMGSLDARRLLAEYFTLPTARPSRLHSAILSCAVKMAVTYPEFHFVPFLDIWGLENLRPEDNEARFDDSGKRFPSLAERMTKAYAYSLLFHPDEHLLPQMERVMSPVLRKKGYHVDERDGVMSVTTPMLAMKTFTTEVRNRRMTFVPMLSPQGDELVAEVHTITEYNKIRYAELEGKLFDVVLRTSDNGNLRVEAAYPSRANVEECFHTSVGYVEHLDPSHFHIHIYDNESRHLVQKYVSPTNIKEGMYVRFVPILPKEGNFKSAFITSLLENGPETFGYRDVVVTYCNAEQGYCAWELLADADGKVLPIVETGVATSEPATKGYISKQLLEQKGMPLPQKGDKLKIVTFLKRGKDGKKRPMVVEVCK